MINRPPHEKPPRDRVDEIYSAIRGAILRGEYAPGERLVETRLAMEYGVSRTRIRDSLSRLSADMLVAPAGGRGLVVRPLSPTDIEEIYELRLLLEGYAAKTAAANITSQELRRLEELTEMMISVETAGGGPSEDDRLAMIISVTDLNNEFHRTIQQSSRNGHLVNIVQSTIDLPLMFKSFYWYSDLELAEAADDHRRIVQALRDHDGPASEQLMREHITRGLNTLRREMA